MNGYRNVRNLLPLALPIVLAVLFISIIFIDRSNAQEAILDGVNTETPIIEKPIENISSTEMLALRATQLEITKKELASPERLEEILKLYYEASSRCK